MIQFVSITAFRQALNTLLKVKHGDYSSVPDEICRAFLDIEDAELRALVNAFSVESKSRQVVIQDIYDHLKEKA